jgi:ELWxxDGT repeat protein
LIFSASGTGFDDRELWATDGTDTNTFLIKDIYPPEYFGSDPDEFVEIGGLLFFAAENGQAGRELFTLEEIAPAVEQVIVGEFGAPDAEIRQRSSVDLVTVVFEGQVDVPADVVKLVNRDTQTELTSLVVATRLEAGKTLVELTFGSGPSVVDRDPGGTSGLRNTLIDGNYELTILAATVSSKVSSPVSGVDMAVDQVHGAVKTDLFFSHFGDSDGDRDIDMQDFGRFGISYLTKLGMPGYSEEFDFDGDGDVDGLDHARFSRKFLQRMDFD